MIPERINIKISQGASLPSLLFPAGKIFGSHTVYVSGVRRKPYP